MPDTPPMWRCPDGGTCHHNCKVACFRVLCCSPLSEYGERWSEKLRRRHKDAERKARH